MSSTTMSMDFNFTSTAESLFSTTMKIYTDDDCSTYGKNGTALSTLQYGGIPQNLMLCLIVWGIVMVGFSIARKAAWNYGRSALMTGKQEERSKMLTVEVEAQDTMIPIVPVTSVDSTGEGREDPDPDPEDIQNTRTKVTQRVTSALFSLNPFQESQRNYEVDDNTGEVLEPPDAKDTGLCTWVLVLFKITDAHIKQRSGLDAIQYLQFERYIICTMGVICLLSISVILPLNFTGNLDTDPASFGRTTISNLDAESPLLWVHASFSVLYLIILLIAMRLFTKNVPRRSLDATRRTIFVQNIVKECTEETAIISHFNEAYPDSKIVDLHFAYNVSKLMEVVRDRRKAYEAKEWCVNNERDTGEKLTLRPQKCGQLCCCDCGKCQSVDALKYYTDQEEQLNELYVTEKDLAVSASLGMAFITMQNVQTAARIVEEYARLHKLYNPPPTSSQSDKLQSGKWLVEFAPLPDDVLWENLSVHGIMWWVRSFLMNVALFLLLLFFTTPAIVMNTLEQWNYERAFSFLSNTLVSQFIPTVLLCIFSALLPMLVILSGRMEHHWFRSTENHIIMKKTFVFLLLMVLILPSLGLTSAKALIEWFMMEGDEMRWECLFLPDNGAFFVNYVTTSALIGTAFELFRVPELIMYGLAKFLAKSPAEIPVIRQGLVNVFQYGVRYAWLLTIYTIVTVYSIICPLIVPFGLLYLVMKYFVDRYNIYFAYAPSRIDKNIHASAVNFVLTGGYLQLCIMMFFTTLRLGGVATVAKFLLGCLIVATCLWAGRACFGCFSTLSPHYYTNKFKNELFSKDDFNKPERPYEPRCLRVKGLPGSGGSSPSQSYGAMSGVQSGTAELGAAAQVVF